MGAPYSLAWGGFRNGQIPVRNLVDIGGGKLLQADAAAAFSRWAAAFRARWNDRLYLMADQDAYRDLARQQYMINHPELYPHAHAAPGTSIHGWARSVDVTGYGASGSVRHLWMQETGPKFGWVWTYGRELGESWHWDYTGPITTTAGGGVSPFEEDIMAIKPFQVRNSDTGGIVACIPGVQWTPLTADYYTLMKGWEVFEENDYTKAPNFNVPSNIFTYFQTLWAPKSAGSGTVSVDLSKEVADLKAAIAAGDADVVDKVLAGVRTITFPAAQVDVDALAVQLEGKLGGAIAAELGKRLVNG